MIPLLEALFNHNNIPCFLCYFLYLWFDCKQFKTGCSFLIDLYPPKCSAYAASSHSKRFDKCIIQMNTKAKPEKRE